MAGPSPSAAPPERGAPSRSGCPSEADSAKAVLESDIFVGSDPSLPLKASWHDSCSIRGMKTTTTAEPGYTRKVLLLDDDGTTLAILSRRLQEHGMEVVTCREIEAAEAILDHTRVDAVVTDLCVSALGGLEGTRLIRHMATHFPETD